MMRVVAFTAPDRPAYSSMVGASCLGSWHSQLQQVRWRMTCAAKMHCPLDDRMARDAASTYSVHMKHACCHLQGSSEGGGCL